MKVSKSKVAKVAKVEVKQIKKIVKAEKPHQTEIFEYIRRNYKGKMKVRTGVVLAQIDRDNVVKIAWSKCAFKKGDEFDPSVAINIAEQRVHGIMEMPPTPSCIRKQVRQFAARCARYYRGAKTIEIPV